MHTLTPRARQMLLAAILAASGLPASSALAQFTVDYADKPARAEPSQPGPAQSDNAQPAPAADEGSQRVVVISSDEGGHSYEVRVVNGVVEFAKADGKELGNDRIRIEGEVIVLLDKEGESLHEFRLPGAPSLAGHLSLLSVSAPRSSADGGAVHLEVKPGFTWTSDDMNDGELSTHFVVSQPPRVMLGINLSEPSPALRKQLKLGEDQQVILVEGVLDGLPADKAGMEDFDVILSIDGSDQASGETLRKALANKNPGDTLKLVVLRGGERHKIEPILARYDASQLDGAPAARSGSGLGFTGEGVLETPQAPRMDMGARGRELRDQSFEQIASALRRAGIDDAKIHEIDSALRESLRGLEEGVRESMTGPSAPGWTVMDRMQRKAEEAMRDAQRQMLEFRDGKLILRSHDDMGKAMEEYRQDLLDSMPSQQELRERLEELEARLGELDERLDRQLDQMSGHMERLSGMFDRIMARLENRTQD